MRRHSCRGFEQVGGILFWAIIAGVLGACDCSTEAAGANVVIQITMRLNDNQSTARLDTCVSVRRCVWGAKVQYPGRLAPIEYRLPEYTVTVISND